VCDLVANIRMSQKVAKPTLTGQRIKTRKRGKMVIDVCKAYNVVFCLSFAYKCFCFQKLLHWFLQNTKHYQY